jgi:hypothetical protein
VNPFGVYMNAAKGAGIAPPLSGSEAISEALVALGNRAHRDVISFPAETPKRFKELETLQNMDASRHTR